MSVPSDLYADDTHALVLVRGDAQLQLPHVVGGNEGIRYRGTCVAGRVLWSQRCRGRVQPCGQTLVPPVGARA